MDATWSPSCSASLRFSASFVSQKATKRIPGNLRFRGAAVGP